MGNIAARAQVVNQPHRRKAIAVGDADKHNYDNIRLFVLGIFAVYIFSWFLQLGTRIDVLGAIRIELVLALVLIGLAFITPRQQPEVKCNLFAFIALYYVALIIQLAFSHDFTASWTIFIDRVVKFSFMAFFIVVFVRTPLALKLFLGAFLLACFKMGQEGLVGTITGSMIWENQGVMRLNGTTPLYAHPNSFSGMALGTLPFIYYLFPITNKWGKLFLAVLLVFSLTIILYAASRTTYVGFLVFCLLLLLKSKQKFKFILIGSVVLAVAFSYIPQQYIERFESITGQEKEGHSKERRLGIIEDALVIFSEHPFGIGVAAFPAVRIERFGRFQDTHNTYLELATNLGIQGLIIWLAMIIAIFRNIGRINGSLDRELRQLAARAPPEYVAREPRLAKHVADLKLMRATLGATGMYLAIRLCLGLFGHDTYEIYWWVVLGLVIAIHNLSQVASRITRYHLAEIETPPSTPQLPAAAAPTRAPLLAAWRWRREQM
jgi:O-antigen ligase